MGRHAQANRRGSATQGYTQAPPTNADWDIAPDAGFIDGSCPGAGPGGGVDFMEFMVYRVDTPSIILGYWQTSVGGDSGSPDSYDDLMGVRSRWKVEPRPVSGWSAEKQIDLT